MNAPRGPEDGEPGANAVLRILRSPYLMVTLAMLFWAVSTVLVRGIRDESPPMGLSFWRTTLGMLLLLPFVLRPLRRQAALVRRNLGILALLSLLLVVGGNAILFLSLQFTFAINAGVINSVEPVIIIAAAWILFRDPVTPRQCVGIAVSLTGVLVLVARADLATLLAMDFNKGDVLVFGAYVSWGIYAAMLRRAPRELDPRVVLFAMLAVGSLILLPMYLFETIAVRPTVPNWTTVVSAVWLALFSSVLAVLMWNRAIVALGAGRAGVFIHLIPAFTVLLAIVVLGESFRPYHAAGVALIVTGIYLSSRRRGAVPGPSSAAASKPRPSSRSHT